MKKILKANSTCYGLLVRPNNTQKFWRIVLEPPPKNWNPVTVVFQKIGKSHGIFTKTWKKTQENFKGKSMAAIARQQKLDRPQPRH
ncbi:MAG: hypothetical protein NTY53_02845 [Kiritimatiellaeota bacterium]|nr:hypothetical protein [Kiritimatiellota bacterium]